jgi:hypothetical protein
MFTKSNILQRRSNITFVYKCLSNVILIVTLRIHQRKGIGIDKGYTVYALEQRFFVRLLSGKAETSFSRSLSTHIKPTPVSLKRIRRIDVRGTADSCVMEKQSK